MGLAPLSEEQSQPARRPASLADDPVIPLGVARGVDVHALVHPQLHRLGQGEVGGRHPGVGIPQVGRVLNAVGVPGHAVDDLLRI